MADFCFCVFEFKLFLGALEMNTHLRSKKINKLKKIGEAPYSALNFID